MCFRRDYILIGEIGDNKTNIHHNLDKMHNICIYIKRNKIASVKAVCVCVCDVLLIASGKNSGTVF